MSLADLVTRALARGLRVEVLTNLVHLTDVLWKVFAWLGVSLATSYFADNAAQHDAITGRPSYARTKANIAKAVRLGIPLRAGVIDDGGDQRAAQARDELIALGVIDIGYDQVGRGARDQSASATQLCGQCGDGVVAVGPHGEVRACVFARFTDPLGDIRTQSLDVLRAGLPRARRELVTAGLPARSAAGCDPETTGTNCSPRPAQRIRVELHDDDSLRYPQPRIHQHQPDRIGRGKSSYPMVIALDSSAFNARL